MEPITTTIAIGAVVNYLAKTLKDNKTFNDFVSDFTAATVNWIRPIFLKDDKPKDVLDSLQLNPESENRRKAAEIAIATHLEDNPETEKLLLEMYNEIQQKKESGQQVNIQVQNSHRVNTGNISASGDITQNFGDSYGTKRSE